MMHSKPEFKQALIEAISNGLPLVKRPYEAIAASIGYTEAQVMEGIQDLIQRGDIKRFGVVVRHRKLGYRANAMVVWNIPDERVSDLGKQISRYDFVNLCYRRPRRLPDWPYNLFCMIHGQDQADVKRQIEQVINQCGLSEYSHDVLFSRRCFKQRGATFSSSKTVNEQLQLNQVTDLG